MDTLVESVMYYLYRFIFRVKKNNEFISPPLRNCHKRVRRAILRGFWCAAGIEYSRDSYISTNVKVIQPGGLKLGRGTKILSNCIVDCRGGVSLGDRVLLGFDSVILTETRGYQGTGDNVTFNKSNKGPVVVNDDVFIGSRSMLMPNIRIASASVIGSCSLLTSGKEFQGLIYGSPARIIKEDL